MKRQIWLLKNFWAAIPILILTWKWMPHFIPAIDVILMNQTLRLFAGVFFFIYFFFPLFFSFRKRILTATALLCSVLLISEALYFAGSAKSGLANTEESKTFSVYSQNILTNAIKRKKYDLFETVGKLQPDVIVLQEVSLFDSDILIEKFKSLGYTGYPSIDITPNEALGYAVFSKLPVRNAHAEIIPGVDWSPLWPVQAFEFLFHDQWVSCLNVHLMPPHHGERGSFNVRPMQQCIAINQINMLLEYHENKSSAALICGDFNQTPTSKILSKLRREFTDSWREAGSGFGFTWNMRRPLFRIDYIWHNDLVTAIESEIVETDYSDHFGIYTIFKLNSEK